MSDAPEVRIDPAWSPDATDQADLDRCENHAECDDPDCYGFGITRS